MAEVLADWADVALEAGQLKQAEDRARRALTLSIQYVGEAHPHSIDGEEQLAAIWQRQGSLNAAYEGQMKVLAKREAVWGTDHPLLADSLEQLAELCRQMGNGAEEENHNQRRLALSEAAHGSPSDDLGREC